MCWRGKRRTVTVKNAVDPVPSQRRRLLFNCLCRRQSSLFLIPDFHALPLVTPPVYAIRLWAAFRVKKLLVTSVSDMGTATSGMGATIWSMKLHESVLFGTIARTKCHQWQVLDRNSEKFLGRHRHADFGRK